MVPSTESSTVGDGCAPTRGGILMAVPSREGRRSGGAVPRRDAWWRPGAALGSASGPQPCGRRLPAPPRVRRSGVRGIRGDASKPSLSEEGSGREGVTLAAPPRSDAGGLEPPDGGSDLPFPAPGLSVNLDKVSNRGRGQLVPVTKEGRGSWHGTPAPLTSRPTSLGPAHGSGQGCRQLRGWTPCLKPDAWGAGGYVSGGRCVTLQAQQCRTRGFPMGREQEAVSAVDPPGCHLGHGADPPPAAVGPWVGAGCGILEPCANKCV
ncbi:unnamed protein product [Rangifer tarandus platyrhynchus]|uniref:Uncharacterized protein n=1 Tax=Rangifer tarandus platyrhynchus TaxID=3082113 RepID=A0ABN8YAW3_RANTA|nr:unnamed protein product [Rangifer tarandus platyrhynchus]